MPRTTRPSGGKWLRRAGTLFSHAAPAGDRGMTPLPDNTPAGNGAVPPLRHGDRLTRAEFERRYDAMPHLKKAELIEGVVYMPSSVRLRSHGNPHGRLIG